jgi:hypothetical protein
MIGIPSPSPWETDNGFVDAALSFAFGQRAGETQHVLLVFGFQAEAEEVARTGGQLFMRAIYAAAAAAEQAGQAEAGFNYRFDQDKLVAWVGDTAYICIAEDSHPRSMDMAETFPGPVFLADTVSWAGGDDG